MKPFFSTIQTLAEGGKKNIPSEYAPANHLIYSAPATLAYNSPGAIGFGVKRAALVIPESVMLLISPASCGRNSTILSQEEGYAQRMFYLLMNETDLVTGRHLRKINKAIEEIKKVTDAKVIVICITCVDALLATDLESICKNASEKTGRIVIPSYMYALEREGRKPPMTAIRQTIYSLVQRKKVDPRTINLMGFFSPINPQSELFPLLTKAGIQTIHQVSCMKTLEENEKLGSANFNVVLHPESIYAAEDLKNRLNMPYIEIPRVYEPDRIHKIYHLFGQAVGIQIEDEKYYQEALHHKLDLTGKRIVVGEMCNANPFELAITLALMGACILEIFSNVTSRDIPTIQRLAKVSPDTKVYTGISPSMIQFEPRNDVDLTIGKDAGQWYKGIPCIEWNSENQPFGYQGFMELMTSIKEVLK